MTQPPSSFTPQPATQPPTTHTPATLPPFDPEEKVQHIATGATWAEGPLWIPGENVVRWSDIPGNRILQMDPETGETIVWQTNVEFTNGRAHHPDLGIIQCSHGRRGIEKAPLVPFMQAELLIDAYEGKRLNSPNDVAVHPLDSTIWFTDPPYGIFEPGQGYEGELGYGRCYVFKLDHHGDLTPVVTELSRPNGIAFSPDGRHLYVTNTVAAEGAELPHSDPDRERVLANVSDAEGRHHIWCFDLNTDSLVVRGSGRVFAAPRDGVPDGIAVDHEGRVWSSGGSGITVFSPEGKELAFAPVPETVSNLCFGGPSGTDLFITATTGLYRLRTNTRGAS